jgi:hypothetical protein
MSDPVFIYDSGRKCLARPVEAIYCTRAEMRLGSYPQKTRDDCDKVVFR